MAGKGTLLAAAAAWANQAPPSRASELQQAVARIPDPRVDWLAQRLKPREVTYATCEWVKLPGLAPAHLQALHRLDAVVLVIRAFDPAQASVPHPAGEVNPVSDFQKLWEEWLLLDWSQVQGRLERLRSGASVPRAQRRSVEQELARLDRCLQALESGIPLRRAPLPEEDRAELRGYSLVTFLPALVAVNIDDAQMAAGRYPGRDRLWELAAQRCEALVEVPARLELDLAQLDPQTRREFMEDMGVQPPVGVERLAGAAYQACELISFLTAGPEEVRAWTIRRGTVAREAAGKVHSDMERGFIRAEVVSFEELQRAGSPAKAREAGLLRLEGKEYLVQDGDVIEFRFHG